MDEDNSPLGGDKPPVADNLTAIAAEDMGNTQPSIFVSPTNSAVNVNVGATKGGEDEVIAAENMGNTQPNIFVSPTSSTVNVNGVATTDSEDKATCQPASKAETVVEFFKIARDNRQATHYNPPYPEDFQPLKAFYSILTGKYPSCCAMVVFYLEAFRIDLEWAKAAACCRREKEPVKPWSQFNKEFKANRCFPLFTLTVIFLCIMIHCYRMNICDDNWMVMDDSFSEVFMLPPFGKVERGEYYRHFTSIFHHGSLGHLIRNMLALWLCGYKLEQIHGHVVIGIIFTLGGASASMTYNVLDGIKGLQGASGSVYALVGAFYADIWTNWDLFEADSDKHALSNETTIATIARVSLPIEFVAFATIIFAEYYMEDCCDIAHSAHLGGFIFGFCLSLPLLKHSRSFDSPMDSKPGQKAPLWSRSLRFFCVYGALSLFLFMAVRIWSYDGSPPLYCPHCFDVIFKVERS